MKLSTSFVCQECGYESPQWLGKCPECGTWNSLKEFRIQPSELRIGKGQKLNKDVKPKTLKEIQYQGEKRLLTGFSEMDGVLGGGIVAGSVILLAGDPGIGKSTLLLQIALSIAGRLSHAADDARPSQNKIQRKSRSLSENRLQSNSLSKEKNEAIFSSSAGEQSAGVLYISGEESEEQIKMRALRLLRPYSGQVRSGQAKNGSKNLLLLSQTNTDAAVSVIEEIKPTLVIVDSIQTMESENLAGLAGSVGQVRYAALNFVKVAKTLGIPVILVGHVTKEGMVAGPMVLSHIVDVLLFLEGEKNTGTRILRGLKNRFGPIDEVGVFILEGRGLEEVKNPQAFFLTETDRKVPGSVLVATIEGTRSFLVEMQSLVVFSKQTFPRRVAIGVDSRRLELLIAVLQKQCRLPLDSMDVFVNVAGGLKLSDPAADLGVCLAIFSSFKNIPLAKTVCIAEVGLLGELRTVGQLEKRIKEAKKLGFNQIISAKTHKFLNEVINRFK